MSSITLHYHAYPISAFGQCAHRKVGGFSSRNSITCRTRICVAAVAPIMSTGHASGTSLLDEVFLNEDHVRTYELYLAQIDEAKKAGQVPRIRSVSAVSDFAPICEMVDVGNDPKDDKETKEDRSVPEGWTYGALRFPLLFFVLWLISLDFCLYILVRQAVNVIEKVSAWHGMSGKLRRRLQTAYTYRDWKRAALDFDAYRNYDEWKSHDASPFYDWRLVQRVVRAMRLAREQDQAQALMGILTLCVKQGFAGIENLELYSQSFYGTKQLIERYYYEVEESLAYLESTPNVSVPVKSAFYRAVFLNFGRSALCLSGGAAFAYYHIGVARALLDANLLPNIVSGISAGGLIAALLCTRTNEELKELLVPDLARHITGCDDPMHVWIARAWRTGARFDTSKWARKVQFFTRGSLTFREAFERTGKTLNISVVPFEQHSPAQLMNHVTAPDCIVWSAVLASAAVPGILNPVCLLQKLPDGSIIPWSWGNQFRDGSLRVDIPLESLNSMFNVTHPIVSQVNPHVHLFHFGSRGAPGRPTAFRRGRGWRGGFLLSAAEHILKLNLLTNLAILRDLALLPKILGQDWSSLFLQKFQGTVTIYPKSRLKDWPRILTDPDATELAQIIHSGCYVTYPKQHMISHLVRIERAILRGKAHFQSRSHVHDTCEHELRDAAIEASDMLQRPLAKEDVAGSKDAGPSRSSNRQDDRLFQEHSNLLELRPEDLEHLLDRFQDEST